MFALFYFNSVNLCKIDASKRKSSSDRVATQIFKKIQEKFNNISRVKY